MVNFMDNKEKKTTDKNLLKNNNSKETQENLIDINSLQNKKIDDLKLHLLNNEKKINDMQLRQLANIENIKKNTEEKIKNIKETEIEKFLKTILPIIDSLEDILKLSNTLNIKDRPLIQGIELTLQSLLNILYKLGVKIEGKKNELFNPKVHTQISTELSEKIPQNHIISIKKKGFTLNKVLLRKAIVTVSKN